MPQAAPSLGQPRPISLLGRAGHRPCFRHRWGKFLATVVALSAPHTLVFITYTDRGHDKLFRKFVERRVEKFFRTARVAAFLLHPVAHPGTPGRLEQVRKEGRKEVKK